MAAALTASVGLVHGRVDAYGCPCHRQGSAVVSIIVLLFRIHSFFFSLDFVVEFERQSCTCVADAREHKTEEYPQPR